MPHFSSEQSHNGNPTAAEIFRVFRNTTMASIEGLRLLLGECADLRAELVTIHGLHGDGDGVFSARQQNREQIITISRSSFSPRTVSRASDGVWSILPSFKQLIHGSL